MKTFFLHRFRKRYGTNHFFWIACCFKIPKIYVIGLLIGKMQVVKERMIQISKRENFYQQEY